MPKIELVFFGNCPNVNCARTAIRAAGITNFTEVNQDMLNESDPYLGYSSPSILVDGEIIVGSCNEGAACTVIDWKKTSAAIASRVSETKQETN